MVARIDKRAYAIFFIWLVVNLAIIFTEARVPGTDIFLFKDAGVNLALQGKFVAQNLAHMRPFSEAVYAYYPPIYPLLFGIWSKVMGVGLKQSIFFDAIIRAVRTLLLLLFVASLSPKKKWDTWLTVFLFALSLVSVDPDRPEDLAHVFGLIGLWILAKKSSLKYVGGSAIFLGMTASVSPAGGVFYGLVMTFYLLQKKSGWKWVAILGMISLTLFLCINLPVRLADPEAALRFSRQVWRSNFPYAFPWLRGWEYSFYTFSKILRHTGTPGIVFSFLIFVLATAGVANFLKRNKRARDGWPRALFAASAIYIPIKVFVWTAQPYYFWFCAFGFFAFLLLDCDERSARKTLCILLLAISPLLWGEAKALFQGVLRPTGFSSREIAREIESVALPTHKVAVSPDAFFTLRTSRFVSDINFVCPYMERFEHVFISTKTEFHCDTISRCFTVSRDLTNPDASVFLGRKSRDFGGLLYSRKPCTPSNP